MWPSDKTLWNPGLEHKMSSDSEYLLLLNVTESYVFTIVVAAETVIKQQKF